MSNGAWRKAWPRLMTKSLFFPDCILVSTVLKNKQAIRMVKIFRNWSNESIMCSPRTRFYSNICIIEKFNVCPPIKCMMEGGGHTNIHGHKWRLFKKKSFPARCVYCIAEFKKCSNKKSSQCGLNCFLLFSLVKRVFPGSGGLGDMWFSFALWLITAKQNVLQRVLPDLQRFADVLHISADDPVSRLFLCDSLMEKL